MSPSNSKIVFVLTGSIAAFKACAVISRLVQDGNEVQTVATPSALKFIGAATLEGLTGKPVLSDLWENGRAMEHIHLSRWADFGVICPASANTVSQLAQGSAEGLVNALILAWPKEKPLHVFPAMNALMLSNPLTQKNLRILSEQGFTLHPTAAGNLACGEEGSGRLLEPEEILGKLFGKPEGRILITAGATQEPIDGIRFLSNVSTGRTGAALADHLVRQGWQMTFVHGPGSARPKSPAELVPFTSFASLNEVLRQQLSTRKFTAVIHAAAVSDYSIASVNNQKPETGRKLKSQDELQITLKPNFKILARLKEYSLDKNIRVIGFKLTLNQKASETMAIARRMICPDVDAVVANDWSMVNKDRSLHPGQFVLEQGHFDFTELADLAGLIQKFILKGDKDGPVS